WASSRVGTSTSACSQRFLTLIFSMSGKPNASVLPEPVCAWPMTSRPSTSAGMVPAWMGVGTSICWDSSTFRLEGLRPSSRNDEDKRIPFATECVEDSHLLDDQCECGDAVVHCGMQCEAIAADAY